MSKLGTTTYKETLKQYAFGVAQDVKSSLADFIAPRVPVGVGSGQFKIFNDKDAFQIYDTRRAGGGPATRIAFDADDGTFNCEANALETPIDDTERERAGENDSALEEARTRTLVINASLAREKRVFDLIKSKVSAAATWNHAGTDDPIELIDAQIQAIANDTGLLPNRMVIGLGAWAWLKNNKAVLDRHVHTDAKAVSLDGLAAMLLNPQMEILLFHGNDNPTQFDPSFAKTFSIGSNSVESVRTYREERNRSDILAVDWSEDVRLVSTLCAKRISVS